MKMFFAGFAVAVIPWLLAGLVWWVLAPPRFDSRPADDDAMRWREGGIL